MSNSSHRFFLYSAFPEAMPREGRGSHFSPLRRCCHLPPCRARHKEPHILHTSPTRTLTLCQERYTSFWGRSAGTGNRFVAVFPPSLTSPSLHPPHTLTQAPDLRPTAFTTQTRQQPEHAGSFRSAGGHTMDVRVIPRGSPAGTPTCAAANGEQEAPHPSRQARGTSTATATTHALFSIFCW